MTAALSAVETTAPEPADQVLSVRYAGRTVRRSDVLHDYGATGEPDGDLEMDYNFWVIHGPDGVTLFDTGYDVAARDWLGESRTRRESPAAPGPAGRVAVVLG